MSLCIRPCLLSLLAAVSIALAAPPEGYQLRFSDEFNSKQLDAKYWSKINGDTYYDDNKAEWREHHTKDEKLYISTDNELVLNAEVGEFVTQHINTHLRVGTITGALKKRQMEFRSLAAWRGDIT